MTEKEELREIIIKFAESEWDLIDAHAKGWLAGGLCAKEDFVKAVEQADEECGSCGCEYDALYKRFLALKEHL
jgi:hypothetical protein